jgi:hypothetical protein
LVCFINLLKIDKKIRGLFMKISFRAKSNKAILSIKDRKVSFPLNYVQYIFGNRDFKPTPKVK